MHFKITFPVRKFDAMQTKANLIEKIKTINPDFDQQVTSEKPEKLYFLQSMSKMFVH